MENKLTLENIQGFLSYGIKFMAYETVYTAIGATKTGVCIDSTTEYAIGDCKPILREMDLTKPITVEGKEINPLIELANIAFPNNEVYGKWKLFKNKDVAYCDGFTFTYTEGGFYAESRYSEDAVFVPSQKCLFKCLYKHKFDIDNLIDQNLAIDVETLELNPYE